MRVEAWVEALELVGCFLLVVTRFFLPPKLILSIPIGPSLIARPRAAGGAPAGLPWPAMACPATPHAHWLATLAGLPSPGPPGQLLQDPAASPD